MDFNDTPEENNFRLEVRDWLKNNAPKEKNLNNFSTGFPEYQDYLKKYNGLQEI